MLIPVEVQQPICVGCVHLRPVVEYPPRPTCSAFPDGIPEAIWADGFDHRAPFEGDNGVRFELADTVQATTALQGYEASLT